MEITFESILTSLASLTLGTLIGAEVTRFFYRPKVVVRYKEIEPLIDQSGVYWSVNVENYGRTTAENCTAVISLYEVKTTDILSSSEASLDEHLPEYTNEDIDLETPRAQILKTDHFRSLKRVSLCWSHLGNPETLDISPGISRSVDICKLQQSESGNYLIFPSEQGWREVRVRLKLRDLEGHILVCPSNDFPTRINIKFSTKSDGVMAFSASAPSFFSRFRRNRFD